MRSARTANPKKSQSTTNPFDITYPMNVGEHLDSKQAVPDNLPLVGFPTELDVPLNYLSIFTESEIQALETLHGKTRLELDFLIAQYKWTYLAFRTENGFAIGTDVSYSLFQIVTSRDGVQNVARLFYKGAIISDTLGLVIGTPIALVDMAFNLTAVSAAKEGIRATLEYALRDSYKEQAKDFIEQAQAEPLDTAATVVKWSFNKTVLYTHNVLGALANIIAFYEPIKFSLPHLGEVTVPAWMPLLPLKAQAAIAAGFVYGGNRYYSLFSNPDYLQNFDEFWLQGFKDLWNNNPDGSPWLLGELYRGNIATPLQIAIQGLLSTVAIRAYPSFYYIAEAIFEKLLGLDPNTTAALAATGAVIIAWHTLCARYPKTYNRYMADHIKIETLLRNNLQELADEEIERLVNQEIDRLKLTMDPSEIDDQKATLKKQTMANFVTTQRKLYYAQIAEAEGIGYPIKKDPALGPQLAFRGLVGLYLGYSTLSPLLTDHVVDEPISMTLLSVTLGASLLAGALYQAEKHRLTDQLILQKMHSEDKPEEEQTVTVNPGSKTSDRVADFITFGSNLSRALSIMGLAKRVGGGPAVTSATAIIAAENMVNSILFTFKKVRSTVFGWGLSCFRNKRQASPSSTPGTMFERRLPPEAAEAGPPTKSTAPKIYGT